MEDEPMEGVTNEGEGSNLSSEEHINKKSSNKNKTKTKSKVYLPGKSLKDGEELVVDESAYRLLHQAQTGAPCLSFDIIPDDLGNSRETYPLSMYMIAGTQAAKVHVNNLYIVKMYNLHNKHHSEDSEDSEIESSDSEYDDEHKPLMSVASIKHQGCVNRVR